MIMSEKISSKSKSDIQIIEKRCLAFKKNEVEVYPKNKKRLDSIVSKERR